MKRIAILTAGGDTPALNATIHGAVMRANQCKLEMIGLRHGFNSLFDERVPHIRLNPLFAAIPELDPTMGGTIIGSSRKYVGERTDEEMSVISDRLKRLKIDGLICVGGDGTLNGLQPLCDVVPTVLSPKTIDNDLGLNYANESDQWQRVPDDSQTDGFRYELKETQARTPSGFKLTEMINYVTPGYATAVYVSAGGVQRIRTTAESHSRVAIIEVMGRHSGYIALGSSYGQPDIVLLPESPVCIEKVTERVKELYDLQQNVVIVCGEGIVDEACEVLGSSQASTDPAGNILLSGAAESLRCMLIESIGDKFFQKGNRQVSAERAIFTRKVGHTQRGGRPVAFDRFHAAQLGGKTVDMLMEGQNNAVSTLRLTEDHGFQVASFYSSKFRDRWGHIHARTVHDSFYDADRMHISPTGIEYLLPIFSDAIGADDTECIRQTLFDSGNLYRRYHSVNSDIEKRVQYLE